MALDVGTIVVGCGNVLFKDDGFGPIIINILNKYLKNKIDENEIYDIESELTPKIIEDVEKDLQGKTVPDDIEFIDGGTGASYFIFTLPDKNWDKVIVIDTVDFKAEPGTVEIFDPFDMKDAQYDDAHGWPVEESLKELPEDCEVIIIGCQPEFISAPDIEMGLTETVENAIPKAISIILNEIGVK